MDEDKEEIVELYEVSYVMDFGCLRDVWRISAKAANHPNYPPFHRIMPSPPVKFEEGDNVMTTSSGRQYKLMSFAGPEKEILTQVKKDVQNKGYEVH